MEKIIRKTIDVITVVAWMAVIVGASGIEDIDGSPQPIAYAIVIVGIAWLGLRVLATEYNSRMRDQ